MKTKLNSRINERNVDREFSQDIKTHNKRIGWEQNDVAEVMNEKAENSHEL